MCLSIETMQLMVPGYGSVALLACLGEDSVAAMFEEHAVIEAEGGTDTV
jgi:hypothetical protein